MFAVWTLASAKLIVQQGDVRRLSALITTDSIKNTQLASFSSLPLCLCSINTLRRLITSHRALLSDSLKWVIFNDEQQPVRDDVAQHIAQCYSIVLLSGQENPVPHPEHWRGNSFNTSSNTPDFYFLQDKRRLERKAGLPTLASGVWPWIQFKNFSISTFYLCLKNCDEGFHQSCFVSFCFQHLALLLLRCLKATLLNVAMVWRRAVSSTALWYNHNHRVHKEVTMYV